MMSKQFGETFHTLYSIMYIFVYTFKFYQQFWLLLSPRKYKFVRTKTIPLKSVTKLDIVFGYEFKGTKNNTAIS